MTTRPLKQPALWPLKVITVLSWALVLFLAAETIVNSVDQLNELLKAAIEKEDYEKAAKIRDELGKRN